MREYDPNDPYYQRKTVWTPESGWHKQLRDEVSQEQAARERDYAVKMNADLGKRLGLQQYTGANK